MAYTKYIPLKNSQDSKYIQTRGKGNMHTEKTSQHGIAHCAT